MCLFSKICIHTDADTHTHSMSIKYEVLALV